MSRQEREPQRLIGLFDATAIALGAIIGAGIFVVLGEAAGIAGATLLPTILVAATVAGLNGLSAAELGVNYPYAGGPYEFGYEVLSPVAGFAAGLLYLLANLVASTTYTLAFAGYLQPLIPGIPLRLVAIVLAILALGVNLAGVSQSRTVNNLLVSFKVIVLVFFVLVGLAYIPLWHAGNLWPPQLASLPRASALIYFAFSGFARPVVIANEIRDPEHTLPRSIIIALATSTVLYLAVAAVALGLVGGEGLAASMAPLRVALTPTGQRWALILLSLGALVATADVLLTSIWGLSRVAYAMAQRGDLPRILARVDRRGVPRIAVLVLGGLIVPLTAAVAFGPALAAASLGQLAYYGITDAAAFRMQRARRIYPRAVPALGLLASVALAFSLPLQSSIILGIVAVVALIYYLIRRRHRR